MINYIYTIFYSKMNGILHHNNKSKIESIDKKIVKYEAKIVDCEAKIVECEVKIIECEAKIKQINDENKILTEIASGKKNEHFDRELQKKIIKIIKLHDNYSIIGGNQSQGFDVNNHAEVDEKILSEIKNIKNKKYNFMEYFTKKNITELINENKLLKSKIILLKSKIDVHTEKILDINNKLSENQKNLSIKEEKELIIELPEEDIEWLNEL